MEFADAAARKEQEHSSFIQKLEEIHLGQVKSI